MFATIAAGKYDELINFFEPDVSFETVTPPGVPIAGVWNGLAMVTEAIRTNFALVKNQQPQVVSLTFEGPNRIKLVGKETGQSAQTGKTYSVDFVQIYDFKNVKIVKIYQEITGADFANAFV